MLFSESMRYRSSCPVCGFNVARVISDIGKSFIDQRVVMCLTCSHAYHNPYDVKASYDDYLNNTYSQEERGSSKPDGAFTRASQIRAIERAQFIRDTILEVDDLNMFEVGSGDGQFLRQVGTKTAIGAELSSGYAEYAVEVNKVDVRIGDGLSVLNHEEANSLSIVALFHVIEHLIYPQNMLSDIWQLLPEGGYLVIEYPELDKALIRDVFYPDPYFHRFHVSDFTKNSMLFLLHSMQFSVYAKKEWDKFPMDKNVLLVCRKDSSIPRIYNGNDKSENLTMFMTARRKIMGDVSIR